MRVVFVFVAVEPMGYGTSDHHLLAAHYKFASPNQTDEVNPPHVLDPRWVSKLHNGHFWN
jgi:hypothetical protein